MAGNLSNRQLTALRNRVNKLEVELRAEGQSLLCELLARYGSNAVEHPAYEESTVGGDSRFFEGEISAAELDKIMKNL